MRARRVSWKMLGLLLAALLVVGAAAGATLALRQSGKRTASLNAGSLAADGGEGTDLEIYGFQAGKADAFLLTTANSAVLIDCGEKGFGQTILDRLEQQKIDHIDVMIITHFDQDHVGGAAKVLNNIQVDQVLQNGNPKDSTEYEKYVKAVNNAGVEPVTVSETMSFVLDGVAYTVDPPHSAKYQKDQSNNSSLIVSVANGEDALLFMGDAQTERIEEFLESGAGEYDLLKVPHHGGEEPLLEALVSVTRPQVAVITSSDSEPEAASTLETLAAYGVETLLTRHGPVLLESTGSGLAQMDEAA